MNNLAKILPKTPGVIVPLSRLLSKLDEASTLRVTIRHRTQELDYSLIAVLDDAIVVNEIGRRNPLIIRLDAIDTMEIIHANERT